MLWTILALAIPFITTLLAVLIAILLSWLFLNKSFRNNQHRQNRTHTINLAIKDLTLNLWFTHELLTNSDIKNTGTYARYWFDGIKQLNLSALTGNENSYAKMTPLIHMLDVDNRKLEDALFTGVIDNAANVQQQLLSWIPLINAIIRVHDLQIPFLPDGEEMLQQIKQAYEQSAGGQQ